MNNEFKEYTAILTPFALRLFKRFLVENHIWQEYHRNFINGSTWRRKIGHEKLISIYNVFIEAFCFSETKEQTAFWRSIDKKWLNYSPKMLNIKDVYMP